MWHPDAAPADSRAALYVFEELLIAMRRDCGYPDTALGRGDVLSLWVNDLPEARAALSRFSKDRGPAKRDQE